MQDLWNALGVLVALYVAYAVFTGNVYARSGPGGRRLDRAIDPRAYWITIAIYGGLAVALVTVF